MSHTLGYVGRKNSKSSIGSHGHAGGTRPGQTRKTPKDLSTREIEESGSGEGVGLYVVYTRERGGGGRGECGFRNVISTVIHTLISQSRGLRQTMSCWDAITETPVYMCEGGWG